MEFDEEASKMLTPLIGRGWFNLPTGKYMMAVYAEGYNSKMRVIDLTKNRKEFFALTRTDSVQPDEDDDFFQLKVQVLDHKSRMPIQGAFVIIDQVPKVEDILLQED